MDKSSKPSLVAEVDDFGRKKYKLASDNEGENQSSPEEEPFIQTGRNLSSLIARDESVRKTKQIGKLEKLKKKKDFDKFCPFRCEVCKVSYSCNATLLDHLNSVSHNRNIGMNLKVKAVSASSVAEKLVNLKSESNKSKRQRKIEKFIRKQEEENEQKEVSQEKAKKEEEILKKENEKEVEQSEGQQQEDEDLAMMRQLGLPTAFSSKNKKY